MRDRRDDGVGGRVWFSSFIRFGFSFCEAIVEKSRKEYKNSKFIFISNKSYIGFFKKV